MKRLIRIAGRSLALEWTRTGDRISYRMENGNRREVSFLEVEPGIYSVLLGSTSYEVRVFPSETTYFIDIRGNHLEVEVIDPRESAFGTRAGEGEGRVSVKAPMPGRVVRVLVHQGDEVSAGQGLVVVEAMKMQNELKSPKAGRIVSIDAGEKQAVAAGQVLAIVE